MKKMNKKGFTIVELVIVIAVIGILATVLIPTFSSVIDKANASKALQSARNALTLALADQKDAALDNEAVIVVDGVVFTYNGQLTIGDDADIPADGYQNTSYVTGVKVYISDADQAQLVEGATYTEITPAVDGGEG